MQPQNRQHHARFRFVAGADPLELQIEIDDFFDTDPANQFTLEATLDVGLFLNTLDAWMETDESDGEQDPVEIGPGVSLVEVNFRRSRPGFNIETELDDFTLRIKDREFVFLRDVPDWLTMHEDLRAA